MLLFFFLDALDDLPEPLALSFLLADSGHKDNPYSTVSCFSGSYTQDQELSGASILYSCQV